MRLPLFILLAAVLAALLASLPVGCADHPYPTESDRDEGVYCEFGDPDIEVDPLAINFGAAAVAEGSDPVSVTIWNHGDDDLHLTGLALDELNPAFEIGPVGAVLIPPGLSTELTLRFLPQGPGPVTALLQVSSDDPDAPVVDVALSGGGLAPELQVSPPELDLGEVSLGCAPQQRLTLENLGNDVLLIEDIARSGASSELSFDLLLDENGPLPWALAPSESLEVEVSYAPLDTYADAQRLDVRSNDPANPELSATQLGTGVVYREQVDVFEQPFTDAVDYVFVVNSSASMQPAVDSFEAGLPAFTAALAGVGTDYQVAIVTEANGCVLGERNFIDGSMAAAAQQAAVTEMLSGAPHDAGDPLFDTAELALSAAATGSGGCNEGLLRGHAALQLVGLTDEAEGSFLPYTYHLSLLSSLKGDSSLLTIHGIAGDYPSGCGSAAAGAGLYEATVATGGSFFSVCSSNIGGHLLNLVQPLSARPSTFELSDLPAASTLQVEVDGLQLNQGWTYHEVDNALQFDANHVPEGGSIIEVYYVVIGGC